MENYEINNNEELQAQVDENETECAEEDGRLDVSGMAQLALMVIGGVVVVKKAAKGALKAANWIGGKIKARKEKKAEAEEPLEEVPDEPEETEEK